MNKIILGYEKVTEDINKSFRYNGRINPTSTYIDEEDSLTNNTDNGSMSFNKECVLFNFFPEQDSSFFVYLGLDNHSTEYDIKPVSEIGSNEKYFYPIHIQSMHIYIKYCSHIGISDKVLSDVRKGNCFIVFSYPNEGNLFYYKDQLSSLVTKLNVPKQNVLVLHADNNVSNFSDCAFTYVPINLFPWWIQNFANVSDIVEYEHERLFSCFNRRMRIDRTQLILELIRYNLIDCGFVSCGDIHNIKLLQPTETETVALKALEGLSPDGLIISGPEQVNPAMNVNFEIAKKTFLTVVPETEARTDEIVYFTEKTFKPILVGHPFIQFNGKHSLHKLKEFGYKTFDYWWDESYDDVEGFIERSKKIAETLSTIKAKPLVELKTIREEMKEILRFNQRLFLKTITENTLDTKFIQTLKTLL